MLIPSFFAASSVVYIFSGLSLSAITFPNDSPIATVLVAPTPEIAATPAPAIAPPIAGAGVAIAEPTIKPAPLRIEDSSIICIPSFFFRNNTMMKKILQLINL